MKRIKSYNKFKESLVIDLSIQNVEDLLESLTIFQDALLAAIGAEEVDIYDQLKLPKVDFSDKMDLDILADNVKFINSLSKIRLKKSPIQYSKDFQTFLNRQCKFMFIYDVTNTHELQDPIYLMIQDWEDGTDGVIGKWNPVKIYKVKYGNKFYDALTFRVIVINDGGEEYTYETSNGNEWVSLYKDKVNDIYKDVMRKEELQQLLKTRNATVSILGQPKTK
jgi:predicted transcriptional regulator